MGGVFRQHRLFSESSQRPIPRRSRGRAIRTLVTLDPLQISAMGQEVYDISDVRVVTLRTPGKAVLRLEYQTQRRKEGSHNWRIPFPPGTKGVLYYHLPPGSPPQAGELRFKKCDSAQQFSSGEDLQVDVGQPWSLSLLNVVQSTVREGCLDELLVGPGLVDHEIVADLQRLVQGRDQRIGTHAITLHDIDQPFITDLHFISFTVRFVTRQSLHILRFYPWPTTSHAEPPFNGRIRARFELADYPGRISLHLRILEIIKPVEHRIEQNSTAEPRAGELLMKRRTEGTDFIPWAYLPQPTSDNHRELVEFLKFRAADKAKFGV
ncbi:hypothetical protein M413DRAFT_449202 [Hebeloma cylindrosporum]|uniref:Uncharacterized protein n=1 Tax=Hebeloma cylindrosporum TaxID=76867 RepID=A0A0C3BXZ9_HEBCY|nr:hypothetical protein M413DRAFT_449202 [Hebeloma cylindrosporum h7]